MMLTMRFLHFLGMTVWIGGMVAAMVVAVDAGTEAGASRRATARLLGKLYGWVIAPGALVTVVTGLALTMALAQRAGSEIMALPGMWGMQATGLLAGLLVLFIGLPTAANLARVAGASDDEALPPLFARLQKRLAMVAQVVVLLAVVALVFATMIR